MAKIFYLPIYKVKGEERMLIDPKEALLNEGQNDFLVVVVASPGDKFGVPK